MIEQVRVVDLYINPELRRQLRPAVRKAVQLALSSGAWKPTAVIDAGNRVLDGAYLVLAAHELGVVHVDCIRAD